MYDKLMKSEATLKSIRPDDEDPGYIHITFDVIFEGNIEEVDEYYTVEDMFGDLILKQADLVVSNDVTIRELDNNGRS